jgi:hypothetical protein
MDKKIQKKDTYVTHDGVRVDHLQWDTSEILGDHYLGTVSHNGKEICFMIFRTTDFLLVDSDTVVKAMGNMSVLDFIQSDVFLDIVSIYKRLTGKEFDLTKIHVDNGETEKTIVIK